MVGDEAELYRQHAARLERIVRGQVHTSPEVVEDACHHAWTKFINQGDDVNRDAALVWLARTAIREAWKLDRRERRELSLDGALEERGEPALPARLPDPAERAEQRERLRELSRLPERQRRLVWLRAAGLSYVEMAAFTGDSVRTVERQVLRASRSLRREGERPPPDQQLSRSAVTAEHLRGRTSVRGVDERGLER